MNVQPNLVNISNYTIGSKLDLSESQSRAIVSLLSRPLQRKTGVLGGRMSVVRESVEGLGRVAIKHYIRGGLLRHFNQRHYIRRGAGRSEREFNLLEKVRSIGVNAPEPIAFVTEGSWLYKAWLVLREIQNHESISDLSLRDEEAVSNYIDDVAKQIDILIRNRIFHVDLHPGNVLVSEGKVFLIDFDKAVIHSGRLNTLRDQYILRWRRAVIKHQLPDVLSELICLRLRSSYD